MTDKEIKAYKSRLRREADPAKHKAYVAAWQAANKDKMREAFRRYYQRNKATMLAKVRAWQKANPDAVRAAVKKWQASNPDKVKAYRRAYYLRRKAIAQSIHA